MYIGMLIFHR